MNRRGFLGSILALAAAPAIVRADSLVRVVPRGTTVLLVELDAPKNEPLLVDWYEYFAEAADPLAVSVGRVAVAIPRAYDGSQSEIIYVEQKNCGFAPRRIRAHGEYVLGGEK